MAQFSLYKEVEKLIGIIKSSLIHAKKLSINEIKYHVAIKLINLITLSCDYDYFRLIHSFSVNYCMSNFGHTTKHFTCNRNISVLSWVYNKIHIRNEIYTLSELMSVGDVAKHLKVSQQYVSSLIRSGSIIGNRVGKQWIVHEKDLQKYIIENKIIIEPDDHHRQSSIVPDLVALSFFSGAMGLDLGMEQEGIKPLLACEIDKEIRKTIHANKPEIALIGDIRDYNAEKILEYARLPKNQQIDIIYGGPPCQAFSTAGKRKGFEDERGNVFLTFIDLAINLNPTYIVLENVRGLFSAKFPLSVETEPIKGGALFYIISKFEERDIRFPLSFIILQILVVLKFEKELLSFARRVTKQLIYYPRQILKMHNSVCQDGLPWEMLLKI